MPDSESSRREGQGVRVLDSRDPSSSEILAWPEGYRYDIVRRLGSLSLSMHCGNVVISESSAAEP
jgi:hypothetical protein